MEPGYVVQRDQSCPIDFLDAWHLFFFFLSFPREQRARESGAAILLPLPSPPSVNRDSVRVYPVAILPKIAEHHASITKYL